jgi:hypothetical protein
MARIHTTIVVVRMWRMRVNGQRRVVELQIPSHLTYDEIFAFAHQRDDRRLPPMTAATDPDLYKCAERMLKLEDELHTEP